MMGPHVMPVVQGPHRTRRIALNSRRALSASERTNGSLPLVIRPHLRILSQVFKVLLLAILLANTCGFGAQRPLSGDKVLLDGFSIEAKKRLFAKVGLTNFVFCGYGQRDSAGDRLCFPVELRDENGQRQDRLVVVTADGVHVKPWHIYNELMTDNDELAVWEERVNETNSTWRLRNNQQLHPGCRPHSVS